MYGFDRTVQTMTPEERQWVIREHVLTVFTDRWAERCIREARSEQEAVRFCQKHLHNWARSGGGIRIDMFGQDVEGDLTEISGHQGTISWLEVVRYARAEMVQAALF